MEGAERKSSVLVSKLVEQYGRLPEARTYIEAEVPKWLANRHSKQKVTASEVQSFETKIKLHVQKMEDKAAAREAGPTHHDVVLPKERIEQESKEQESKAGSDGVPLSYLVYAEASSLEFQEMKRNERRQIMERKHQLKSELDKQMEENAGKGSDQKKIEENYSQTVLNNYQGFVAEQKVLKTENSERLAALKRERDAQLAELNRRRARERAREQKDERDMLAAAAAAVAAEQEKARTNLREQKAFMDRVMAENVENQRMRAVEKLKLQEEEKQLQAEYARRLDEQERVRTETFARMKAKSSQNQAMFVATTAAKNAKDREDEAKALRYQQEKVQRDLESLAAEKRHREEEKARLCAELAAQVEHRRRRDEEERVAKAEFVDLYRSQAQKAIQDAKDEQKARARAALEHRLELQRQIEEKQQRQDVTSTSVMTEAEKKLNRQAIISLVSRDATVVPTINTKLECAKKVEDAKRRRALGIRGGAADLALAEDDF